MSEAPAASADVRRIRWGLLLLGAATFGMGVWASTTDAVGGWFDDGVYLTTARALATGQGFVHDWIPGAPPAVHFPPLWPLLLGALWWLFPDFPGSLAVFKLVNPLLLAVAAVLLAGWSLRVLRLPPVVALLAIAAGVLSVPMLILSNVLLSEVLFLSVLAAILGLEPRARGPGAIVALGALLAALVLTRTIGAVFVIATLMVWARDARWRDLALLGFVVVLCWAPWGWHVARVGGAVPDVLGAMYASYGQVLREAAVPMGEVVARNVRALWDLTFTMASPPLLPRWGRAACAGVALLALSGGALCAARLTGARVAVLGGGGYLAVVLLWPFEPTRFVWGLWPLLLLLPFLLLAGLRQVLPRRPWQGLAVGVLLLLAAGPVHYSVRGLWSGWHRGIIASPAARTIPFARVVLQQPWLLERRIASEAAPVVALYTGAQVAPIGRTAADVEFRPRTVPSVAADLAMLRAAYHPEVFLVVRGGLFDAALVARSAEDGFLLRELPSGDPLVRLYVLEEPR